ncbi:MAG: hypothetical protein C0168_06915 [Candidatus Aminicenantes bacterium]|nr:MAG: hypothetical protein C0168_06915 [Candidatus Aminicenantes bacterium]
MVGPQAKTQRRATGKTGVFLIPGTFALEIQKILHVSYFLILSALRAFKNSSLRLPPEKKTTPSAPASFASLISSSMISGVAWLCEVPRPIPGHTRTLRALAIFLPAWLLFLDNFVFLIKSALFIKT